jgi:hypothetical protein
MQFEPIKFVFKRDAGGSETVECRGVVVARTNCYSLEDGEYVPVQDIPGIGDAEIIEAIELAGDAGFWIAGTPARCEVEVKP